MIKDKHVYVVLGMARSGTSAITRGLQALNINLGNKLIDRKETWNEKGVWEDKEVVYKINRSISFAIDYGWLSREQLDGILTQFLRPALAVIQERLKESDHWGFKDPRTVKMIPFWRAVFAAAKVHDHYILVLRHPLAVAHSNLSFSKLPLELGVIEWVVSLVSMIEHTQTAHRVVVSYEKMLQDPRQQLERIHKELKLPMSANSADISKYANEFLDKRLHHHDFDEQALQSHAISRIIPLAGEIYSLLMRVARDEIKLESPEFQQAWQKYKTAFERIYPVYQYMETQFKKNRELERRLRSIHNSFPWKLSYPLRVIDDTLRVRREKSRAKKKLGSV